MYEYIWLLCDILAVKWRYFNKSQDYEEFSFFSANKIFERYKNRNLPKVKSCLNYLKKVLYPYKVQFQNQFYCENLSEEKLENLDTKYDPSLEWNLQDKCTGLNKSDFHFYLENVSKTLWDIVSKIPEKKNSSEKNDIYISCLLTFLDLITPETKSLNQYNELIRSENIRDNFYKTMYKVPKDYKPILYHLDDKFQDYILILVKEARICMRNDLNELLYSSVPVKDLYVDALNQLKEEDDN